MITTVCGTNFFAVRQKIEELRKQYSHLDFSIIDAGELKTADIIQHLNGISLFSEHKFTVLRGLNSNTKAQENLEKIVGALDEQSVLIIQEEELDKRTKYYKVLKKLTQFNEFGELNEQEAQKFAQTYAKERGANIGNSEAAFLIQRVGLSQGTLANEIDKLALYDPHITKKSIEELTDQSFQETVFQLTDAIINGNTKKTIELYRGLRAARLHPLEVMGTLSWQLHVLVQIKAHQSVGSPEAIAEATKLHPFVVQKNYKLVRQLTTEQLRSMVDDSLETDFHLKTTQIDPDDLLETLLLKLIRAID